LAKPFCGNTIKELAFDQLIFLSYCKDVASFVYQSNSFARNCFAFIILPINYSAKLNIKRT